MDVIDLLEGGRVGSGFALYEYSRILVVNVRVWVGVDLEELWERGWIVKRFFMDAS